MSGPVVHVFMECHGGFSDGGYFWTVAYVEGNAYRKPWQWSKLPGLSIRGYSGIKYYWGYGWAFKPYTREEYPKVPPWWLTSERHEERR